MEYSAHKLLKIGTMITWQIWQRLKPVSQGKFVVFIIFPSTELFQIHRGYSWTVAESRNVCGFLVVGLVFSHIPENRDHDDIASPAAILFLVSLSKDSLSIYQAFGFYFLKYWSNFDMQDTKMTSSKCFIESKWENNNKLNILCTSPKCIWIPLKMHQLNSGFLSLVSLISVQFWHAIHQNDHKVLFCPNQ